MALLALIWYSPVSAQNEMPITDSDREHWSFAPLTAQPIPQITSSRVLGPIDAFIAQKLRALDLDIAPPARPEHLLRRVTFDLTGLPPTTEDRQRFHDNEHLPDAYEREVDRLLASPAAGEHLAQSWLDLARYAETDGFEHDKVRPNAWRYRDWVISAINSDMPYDRFMRLQVAGDLMPNEPDGSLATTFCLAGADMPDLNDQDERRHNLLNEMTGTVGSVLLGLQLGCAACHDHKYDPVSQADFYRLRGVLETGVPQLVRDKPWYQFSEQDKPGDVKFYHRGDHRQPTISLERGVPRIAADQSATKLISTAAQPRLVLADWLASASNPLPARGDGQSSLAESLRSRIIGYVERLRLAGFEPTHPELLDWLAVELREHGWSVQRLRREILLSATYRSRSFVSDMGSDMGSDVTEETDHARRLRVDPANEAYSRYPRRRLTGEMLRDAMLQVAGLIDRHAGGEGVMPPLPPELVQTLLPNQWKVSARPEEHSRRSVYVFARRNLRYPIFESFDRPDAGATCAVRGQSVTATQSLLMFNSEFTQRLSRAVAKRVGERLMREEGKSADGLGRPSHGGPSHGSAILLWNEVLGRMPTEMECKLLYESPHGLLQQFQDREDGVAAAALGLFNSNEFILLD